MEIIFLMLLLLIDLYLLINLEYNVDRLYRLGKNKKRELTINLDTINKDLFTSVLIMFYIIFSVVLIITPLSVLGVVLIGIFFIERALISAFESKRRYLLSTRLLSTISILVCL